MIDGSTLVAAHAHGKHLVVEFETELLHIHLGLIGKFRPARGEPPRDTIRLRLERPDAVFDLTGPQDCRLIDPAEYAAITDRLGPDPLRRGARRADFVDALTRRRAPVAAALLDQAVIAGIGNVYRAELLFLLGIDPRRPANLVDEQSAGELWNLTRNQLRLGVRLDRIDGQPGGFGSQPRSPGARGRSVRVQAPGPSVSEVRHADQHRRGGRPVLLVVLELSGLTDGAPRGRSRVDHPAAELSATPEALLARSAVAGQVELVGALAGHAPVVPQGGPAAIETEFEDAPNLREQHGRALHGDTAQRWIDACAEERLIGVDVSDARHGALTQELGLEPPPAAHSFPQLPTVEREIERLGTHVAQCWNRVVMTSADDVNPPEASHVAEEKSAAVVELPPRTEVGIVEVVGFCARPQLSGHAQMDDEITSIVELDHEVLTPTSDLHHPGPGHLPRRRELGGLVASRLSKPAASQAGSQLPTNRLDLGQLGHGHTLRSQCGW